MKSSYLWCSLSILWFASSAMATPYYVNGTCGNDAWSGTSPVCAASSGPKRTIQAGINSTANIDDVVSVADGEYTGTGNRGLIFSPFSGGTTRQITLLCPNPTKCVINCEGVARAFDFDHNVVGELDSGAVVDGFTIKNGSASNGGAVLISDTGPTFQRCVFEGNSATNDGGAVYAVKNARPRFDRCRFENMNTAGVNGGAISFVHAGVGSINIGGTVVDCIIKNNQAGRNGGGIHVQGATPDTPTDKLVIKGTRVEGNTALQKGGGLSSEGDRANVKLVNCVITKNQATSLGGGLAFLAPPGTGSLMVPEMMNTIVSANTAVSGGGIYLSGYTRLHFANGVLFGNTATDSAGGHAVFDDGRTPQPPPLSGKSTLSNAIIWSEPLPSSPLVRVCEPCGQYCECEKLRVEKSDVRGTLSSTIEQFGNISADPVFVDPDGADSILGTTDDNFRILSTSPCLNTGEQAYRRADYGDLDGDSDTGELTPLDLDLFSRWIGVQVEMGPYEFDGCTTNADCGDDGNPCNGLEKCDQAHCVIDIDDCNLNGIDDFCDIIDGTSLDCNLSGIPDECEAGPFPSQLATCSIEHNRSYWRSLNNYLKLGFSCDITLPVPDTALQINQLLNSGQFGGELANTFVLQVLNDTNGRPRILTIKGEPDSTLQHKTWYAVRGTSSWTNVIPFTLHYVNMIGDATNDNRTLQADILEINTGVPTLNVSEAERRDIDGDGNILQADILLTNTYISSLPPAKPSGHTAICAGCCPP